MSDLGTYSFVPWLRVGLANQITTADGDPDVKIRPSIKVDLSIGGEKVGGGTEDLPYSRTVQLYGPGDIVGLKRQAIVRTEPRDWITNFEPNYLAAIEFYHEDLPWRYTPAAPDLGKGRLRPWIALIVLTEGEFKDGTTPGRPVAYIQDVATDVLPPPKELWAWAHVHVNRHLGASAADLNSTDGAAVADRLKGVLNENPDLAYSRLVCPRKLKPNTPYHAFVVPVFEVGRRAGLGLDMAGVPASRSAWGAGAGPEPASLPYYHRWFFHTGAAGDFETLVRLLKPKPVDRRVGTREMDTQFPNPAVEGVDNPALGGILKLGGALRPPTLVPKPPPDVFETWDQPFPRPLQEDLARLINLPDEYERSGDPDPVIAPPLYGRWHAFASRVLIEEDGDPITPVDSWVQKLNLDPRYRVPAGLGTKVIQQHQEKYMDAAWDQIGEVLAARRKIRLGQLALQISGVWHERYLATSVVEGAARTLNLIAPVSRRVLAADVTVRHAMTTALVQPAVTSAAMRRVVRPRGKLIRRLDLPSEAPIATLVPRINAGEITAAPPKVAPPGAVVGEVLASEVIKGAPAGLVGVLRRYPQMALRVLIGALGLGLLALGCLGLLASWPLSAAVAAFVVGVGIAAHRTLRKWQGAVQAADALTERTPEWVDRLPRSSKVEDVRLREALRDEFGLQVKADQVGKPPVYTALDLSGIAATAVNALAPQRTVVNRVRAGIHLPGRLIAEIGPDFVEPMAYPVIDQPMYEPLKDMGSELFLPNVNLIEVNTITLLEAHQEFIEAYMAGINHEFARELLWREYPTDQRGTPFRQFWDVRSFFDTSNLGDEELKEKLRDIPPMHKWQFASKLGAHDHRDEGGEQENELVLVIRGELLKRYPTAVIYAHKAVWQLKSDGTLDNTKERRFAPLVGDEQLKPPKSKVLTPLYEAKIDPDIYIFGFDLTANEAMGGTGNSPGDEPGWFFVIKERPGEPRFGLDTDKQPTLHVWNDLSWTDVQPGPAGSSIVIETSPAGFTLHDPTGADSEKKPQHDDDVKVSWSRDMDSAELAYILFQAPVLVGVHASEMLPR